MIWTAIFADQTIKVFSTHNNCPKEAQKTAESEPQPLFALIKGNHPDVKFFKRRM